MVRAVIFDCFGVLTTDLWREFKASLPESIDRDKIYELNRTYNSGLIDQVEFIDEIKKLTGRNPPLLELLKGEVYKNSALLEYIRELRSRGIRIGLLSNTATNWIRQEFLTIEEQELFDEMILSFEVGFVKPDPRIFMLACERLRVGPHEAVMVDDIGLFCDAARQEGLQAVQYKNFEDFKHELDKLTAR